MAENVQMKLPYVLRRNTSSNPRMSGKYYGRVWEKNLLDTRGLADHMVEHGIVRNNSKVYTILSKLQECIPELLSQGVGVKLGRAGHVLPLYDVEGRQRPDEVCRRQAHHRHPHPHTSVVGEGGQPDVEGAAQPV